MVIRDFVNGVCVGMSVVNLIWFIVVQILIKGILEGGQDNGTD